MSFRSLFIALLVGTLAEFSVSVSTEAAETPEKLLQRADAIRNPADSYKMRIKVKTQDNLQVFEVSLKGTSKTLIVTKAPAKDKGRNMLMLDRDFYTYVPNLKRSMRLSLAQKLSGQVANGDIARTRWFGDYAVKAEDQGPKETRLLLDGTKTGLTYQKIRLWVETKSARPLRTEYLSLDGKTVLKRARFENYRQMAGNERPTVIMIEDTNKQISSIEIESMEPTNFNDSFFTERNMESQQ